MDPDTPCPPTLSTASYGTDAWARDFWGEQDFFHYLKQYASRFYRHEADWEPKSTEELARCITMVRNEEDMAASKLEILIRASRTWQLFDQLTSEPLDLIPYLMKSLKKYCQYVNLVFDRYHGLLCVQLLSTTILAGIINGSNKCKSTLEIIRAECAGQIDIHKKVVVQGVFMINRALGSNSESKEELIRTCFVEHYQKSEPTILPALGGFHKEDAEFLLEELWNERDSFLLASSKLSWQGFLGWSGLLAVIWYYTRHVHDSTLPLQRLRNLILRYSISAPRPESGLLQNLVWAIEQQVPLSTPGVDHLPPVDESDVKYMVMMFIHYLGIPIQSAKPALPPSDLMHPFILVYHNTLTTLPDRVPSLLAAAMERVWTILEGSGPDLTLQKRILHSFEYAVDAIATMSILLRLPCGFTDGMIGVTTVAWTEFLHKVDIIELIGRLCSMLVISANGFGSEFLICPESLKAFSRHTRYLTDTLRLQHTIQVQTLDNLNELDHTWHKVLKHIENQILFYPPGGAVQHRANLCKSIWLEVGKVFDFFPRAPRQHQCMNPRCPIPYPEEGARYICTGCCWVHYCSQRCQALHWDDDSIDGHRNMCLDLSTQE